MPLRSTANWTVAACRERGARRPVLTLLDSTVLPVAIVHLICGANGAGKATYATAIAERSGAVRLSLDEWMAWLYAADAPVGTSVAVAVRWRTDRTSRCEEQMWAVAEQMLARNIDVVFDASLARREDRDRFRMRALQLGAEPKLHYFDVDAATRRARVRRQVDGTGPNPL